MGGATLPGQVGHGGGGRYFCEESQVLMMSCAFSRAWCPGFGGTAVTVLCQRHLFHSVILLRSVITRGLPLACNHDMPVSTLGRHRMLGPSFYPNHCMADKGQGQLSHVHALLPAHLHPCHLGPLYCATQAWCRAPFPGASASKEWGQFSSVP